jgi:hypothetical protein
MAWALDSIWLTVRPVRCRKLLLAFRLNELTQIDMDEGFALFIMDASSDPAGLGDTARSLVTRSSKRRTPPKLCDITEHLTAVGASAGGASAAPAAKRILTRATGTFYTHELIGRHLAESIVAAQEFRRLPEPVRVVEPFCGDGRLACWLLEALAQRMERRSFTLELWDGDDDALLSAVGDVEATAARLGLRVRANALRADTFILAPDHFGHFDLCIRDSSQ